jgi:GMP synthase (glutamine-hydrolysing)
MTSSAKPRVAVIRHLAFEDLGTFAALLSSRGMVIELYDAGVDDTSQALLDADLAIILGGPIGVYETDQYPFLVAQTEAVAQRLRAERPTLGICLGAQLMAAALGARIYPGGHKEIGWSPVELTAAGQASPLAALEGVPVLHWHGDTFDLPEGATLLAGTRHYPHQAFALGPNLLGLQFHVEADIARIEQWLIGHTCELASAGIEPSALRTQTRDLPPGVTEAGHRLLTAWLDQLEW